MKMTIQEKLIWRNVKKSAILWLLMIRLDPKPLTESEASEILEIDPKSIRKYFHSLSELELISRLGRFDGFILTSTGKQMALPLELSFLIPEPNGKFSRSEPVNNNDSCLKDSLKDSLLLIKAERENFPNERENFPFDSQNEPPVEKTVEKLEKPVENVKIDQIIDQILKADPEREKILEELLNARIQMNHRTINLLMAPDITAEEIRSQALALEKRGFGDQTGILITNLESKYRPRGADLDPITGHDSECNCFECINSRNLRFLDGWNSGAGDQYQSWNDENERDHQNNPGENSQGESSGVPTE